MPTTAADDLDEECGRPEGPASTRIALPAVWEWLASWRALARNRFGGASRMRRCCLLIDGDGVPPKLADALVHYASSVGTLVVLEVFANLSSGTNSGWAAQVRKYGMTAFQHYQTSVGKNSADIALIVRAMDLSHTSTIDHFILATSDTDFSALAYRLRRGGASVHGIGSPGASEVLRRSCSVFSTFAELDGWAATAKETPSTVRTGSSDDLEDHLLSALVRLGGARRWVSLSALCAEFRTSHKGFHLRAYSRRTVLELCIALPSIEFDVSTKEPRARIALANRNGSPGEQ